MLVIEIHCINLQNFDHNSIYLKVYIQQYCFSDVLLEKLVTKHSEGFVSCLLLYT